MDYRPLDSASMKPGEIRDHIWTTLSQYHVAAYPLPPYGHHPNFSGAGEAAQRLLDYLLNEAIIAKGQTALCYPDYVLKPVRKGLLEQGIRVIVPAKYGKGFRLLEPENVNLNQASSIAGAEKEGLLIKTLPAIDITFIACVALAASGQVLSKGYGFTLPDHLNVPTATIIHPMQQVSHLETDFHVQIWATPDEVVNRAKT
jgi:5-formyltetrahydrofolate cyclo-ligase